MAENNKEDSLSNRPKDLSKVTPKKQSYANYYWLVGTAIVIGLTLWLSSGNTKKSPKKEHEQAVQTQTNSAELSHNMSMLAKLKAAEKNNKKMRIEAGHDKPLIQSRHDKAYVSRQNAPTSMFSATTDVSHQQNTPHSKSTTAFAGNGGNSRFANQATQTTTVVANKIAHPDFTIASGELVHGVLETAVNSDLPGMVRAVISRPVYAYTGERTLIPAGSRLIGQYSAHILQGQSRIMVIWNRVLLPDGVAVQLNSPGTDSLGRAGLMADSVDTHFFTRFGESALLSIIGAGTANIGVGNDDKYNSAAAYRMSIAQSFQQSAQKSLQGSLPTKPTIHVHQGANINVFVAHDLDFYDALQTGANEMVSK